MHGHRGRCSRLRIAGEREDDRRRGGFRDQVGRLIARRKGKGEMSEGGRSAAGWLLSVDEHCRRIDLSTRGYEA